MEEIRAMLGRQARQPTAKDRETGLPKTYVEGLTASEKQKQAKAIKKTTAVFEKTGKVMDRPGTPSGKRSPHVVKFENTFGFPVTDLAKVKQEFPKTDVETILKKGAAAYASGSRPGQSVASWKFSRLASVLTGGKALAVDKDEVGDADLKKILRRK
jgi:hypothetical protein